MKRLKRKQIIAVLTSLVMMISLISYVPVARAEEAGDSTVENVVTDVSVSKQNPSIDEEVNFCFTVNSDSDEELESIVFFITNDAGILIGCSPSFEKSQSVSISYPVALNYYGTWYIESIHITYANGTAKILKDKKFYNSEDAEAIEYDLSGAYVTVAGTPDDSIPPTICYESISVDKPSVAVDENVNVDINVSDSSGVASVSAMFAYSSGSNFSLSGTYIEGDKWRFNIFPQYSGDLQMIEVRATDKCGNTIILYNKNYSEYASNENAYDLSKANVEVTSENSEDTDAPSIDISLLSIEKKDIQRNETNKISMKISDASEIQSIIMYVFNGKGPASSISSFMTYNLETGMYEGDYTHTGYYGLYEIEAIEVADVNGNKTKLINSALSRESSLDKTDGWIEENLSALNFNVGIFDENDTGIFVSGNGMDEDCTLDVETKEESGDDYSAIIEDEAADFTVEGFYDITMDGTYADGGEKVKVQFDVGKLKNGSKYKDGDKLRIKHKRKNGTIDVEDAIVRDGKIWMHVSEFSPFMVLSEEEDIPVTSITVSSTTVTLKEGEISVVDVTVAPDNATDSSVLWSSDDPSVATVDSTGKITAIKEGTAVITVSAADGSGVSSTINVTVEAQATGDSTEDNIGDNTGDNTEDKEETKEYPSVDVSYITHIQSYGWQGNPDIVSSWVKNGKLAGTSGEGKRLEGIKIVVEDQGVDLGVSYTTHCQTYGWLPWSSNGDMSGTSGESKRLEAIMIQLTGEDADQYDVYYRVHAQTFGWLAWANNGAPAGTAGYGKRLEGIQIVVVKKGEKIDENLDGIVSRQSSAYIAPDITVPVVGQNGTSALNPVVQGSASPNVSYRTHVQTYGWQTWKYNGQISGTHGESKRLEAIELKLTNAPYEGGIAYTTHVQTYGWQADVDNPLEWMKNGAMAGTNGQSRRLEAICISLTGEMADHYDIYYRVHAQTFGWLGWAKNGEKSGTAGLSRRLEGIQILLLPKGTTPADSYGGVVSNDERAYISK